MIGCFCSSVLFLFVIKIVFETLFKGMSLVQRIKIIFKFILSISHTSSFRLRSGLYIFHIFKKTFFLLLLCNLYHLNLTFQYYPQEKGAMRKKQIKRSLDIASLQLLVINKHEGMVFIMSLRYDHRSKKIDHIWNRSCK
jgi:hypothetical protein